MNSNQPSFGDPPPKRCYTCKKPRWAWRDKWVCLNCDLPPTWGLVNGKPFTTPLPDGKPVEIPESWKLPK